MLSYSIKTECIYSSWWPVLLSQPKYSRQWSNCLITSTFRHLLSCKEDMTKHIFLFCCHLIDVQSHRLPTFYLFFYYIHFFFKKNSAKWTQSKRLEFSAVEGFFKIYFLFHFFYHFYLNLLLFSHTSPCSLSHRHALCLGCGWGGVSGFPNSWCIVVLWVSSPMSHILAWTRTHVTEGDAPVFC